MKCPHCEKDIADSVLRAYVSSQNGKAGRGKKKARTSDQMRAAARVRWDKGQNKCRGFVMAATADQESQGPGVRRPGHVRQIRL